MTTCPCRTSSIGVISLAGWQPKVGLGAARPYPTLKHARQHAKLRRMPGAASSGSGNTASYQNALDFYTEYLAEGNEDRDIDLLTAALLIARHRYPDLDEGAVYSELDRLAAKVQLQLGDGASAYPLRIARAISQVLYEQEGFQGATGTYYNPDNSCINMVLQTRRGIPISLSLLYCEVAQRCGLPLLGVQLPGHFMLTPADPDVQLLIDAFFGGELLFLEDAEERLSGLFGHPVALDQGWVARKAAPAPRAFLARWLNNLKHVYLQTQQTGPLLAVQRYIRATLPHSLQELRDEGLFLVQDGQFREGIAVLEEYLGCEEERPGDAEVVEEVIQRARAAMLNQLL